MVTAPSRFSPGQRESWVEMVSEGERIDARSQKREQKNLDRIGSLKASELVAPMLERERANQKILITFFS